MVEARCEGGGHTALPSMGTSPMPRSLRAPAQPACAALKGPSKALSLWRDQIPIWLLSLLLLESPGSSSRCLCSPQGRRPCVECGAVQNRARVENTNHLHCLSSNLVLHLRMGTNPVWPASGPQEGCWGQKIALDTSFDQSAVCFPHCLAGQESLEAYTVFYQKENISDEILTRTLLQWSSRKRNDNFHL